MATRVILKRGNDQIVSLVGLRSTNLDIYLNEAVVKATLVDSKGVPVPAFIDVDMPYVLDSNGTYEWVIESDTMMLNKSVEYQLIVTAVQEGYNYRVVHPVSIVDA